MLLTYENCSGHHPALCGYYLDSRIESPVVVPPVAGASSCPSGWLFFGHNCYKHVDKPLAWRMAEEECFHIGGNLVSITTANEDTFVRSLIPSEREAAAKAWIGLRVFCKPAHSPLMCLPI